MNGKTEWCKDDNCGEKAPMAKTALGVPREIFYCKKCSRLWRRTYKDSLTGNEAFICYESELKEEAQND